MRFGIKGSYYLSVEEKSYVQLFPPEYICINLSLFAYNSLLYLFLIFTFACLNHDTHIFFFYDINQIELTSEVKIETYHKLEMDNIIRDKIDWFMNVFIL